MNNIIDYLNLDNDFSSENILKRIHFKRFNHKLPIFIVDFLKNEYLKTNDIRFFNELLWVINGDLLKIKDSLKHFYFHFNNNRYDFFFEDKYKECLDQQSTDVEVNDNFFKNNSIALIGNPVHFILPFLKFKRNNISVDIINVRYHKSKLMRLIFFNRIMTFIYKLIFYNRYFEIDIASKLELSTFKITKKYDVGFHKLNFIIKDNVISAFSKGLINDHWGALPLFKGRSTLLYSKLFGATPVISNHLISHDIDAGKILMYTQLNFSKLNKQIYLDLKERIYKSINLLCNNQFLNVNNKKGYMFYEMHPWLQNQIKRK